MIPSQSSVPTLHPEVCTQRARYPLISEYTSNHIGNAVYRGLMGVYMYIYIYTELDRVYRIYRVYGLEV